MQGKSMIFEGKTEFGKTTSDQGQVGKSEARRNPRRLHDSLRAESDSVSVSESDLCLQHCLSPQGAGRIQSLRAFRRARLIYAMVQRWAGAMKTKSLSKWESGGEDLLPSYGFLQTSSSNKAADGMRILQDCRCDAYNRFCWLVHRG